MLKAKKPAEAKPKAVRKRKPKSPTTAPAATTVEAWEDDPGDGVRIARPVPHPGHTPLAFTFPGRAPPAATYDVDTPEFRYWTAAEALRRGADFWARIVPLTKWEVGSRLRVLLDEGEDLNAYYDRSALNFFHGPGADGRTVYSGESPDVVCHEMGHAILDSVKPQLWDAAAQEIAAFHESFADISAILSAIQLPSLRTAILSDTNGHLYRSSRLSRLAEQLGAAIRAQAPDAVDRDCLRNAVNSFSYQAPAKLPANAPAAQLSSEPHSFSRLFTGAAFEILASILANKAGGSAPTADQLLAAGDDLGRIVVRGVQQTPVVANWYSQVAASMVQVSAAISPAYPALLKGVFVRRAILSLHSAAAIHQFATAATESARTVSTQALSSLALPSDHYGLDGPIIVKAASQPRPFAAMAMVANESVEPQSASEAARAFVDDLFRRGRVDYAGHGTAEVALVHPNRRSSHRLVKAAAGLNLERVLFDCGFCA